MTLYTSVNSLHNCSDEIAIDSYEIIKMEPQTRTGSVPDDLKKACIYLGISILIAAFGAIYEYFSHGVYSYFMIYAFAIPLIGGALPYLIRSIRTQDAKSSGGYIPDPITSALYHGGLATLTIGSIMKGVLDIYGTTNRLIIIYPIAGVLLIAVYVAAYIKRRTQRQQANSAT